ncbi:IclR family transcriptional regulator [Thalassobacillus hwangdonensis]|uniref:IclR family transcriptional regulator n=1 Tax=Thalassobacillus hwangdonensis TaxID=546108 RepID=A0ABW3L472_9BACI
MNQSVLKALKLLDLFSEEKTEITLKEASEMTKMPKPTVYRLLSTLEQAQFLMKTKESEHDSRYSLGLKLMELGHLVSDQLELRKIALPYMEALAQEINEVVHLVIVHQQKATYIEKVESTRALRLFTRVGKSSPLYIGSGPKLLLAYMDEDEQQQILEEADLLKLSDHDPIDESELMEELLEIKEKGYAFSLGEQDLETTGISYPIYDFRGNVIAALAISGLSSHFEGENLLLIKHHAEDTAASISAQLGYKTCVSNTRE